MFKNLRPLFPYLRKYRATFWVGALCVLCNSSVWILFSLVIKQAVDDLNTGVTVHKLWVYSAKLLAVAGTRAIFQFLTRWILIGASREIEFDLRNDLFRHLERLSYGFYQRTRTGDIMARATNDLNAVRISAAAHRQHRGAALRAQDPRALRAYPGDVFRHLGKSAGKLLRRPPDSRLCAGAGGDRKF